jgi:hypothetical protein
MTNKSSSAILHDDQRKIAVNLFRYTLWANSLMSSFEVSLNRDLMEMKRQLAEGQTTFDTRLLESEMYHCLWFGVLHIVIEGWPKLRVKNQKITKLLRSPYKKLLRNFRNAIFHPEDYDDERIKTLMKTGQPSIDWAKETTKEFKTFFEILLLSCCS